MESQPQNPEFRINPENFHPCLYTCETCDDGAGLFLAPRQGYILNKLGRSPLDGTIYQITKI